MADETFSNSALLTISLSISEDNDFPEVLLHGRDPDRDQTFYCDYTDTHGNQDAGIPEIVVTLTGIWLNRLFVGSNNDAIINISVELTNLYSEGVHIYDDTVINISLTVVTGDSDVYFEFKQNFVMWGKIGEMDFTKGRDNIAGERPMDWKGWIYGLKKLVNKVVSYGKNGVTLLNPAGNTFGMRTIHKIGLKGKLAFTGNDDIHFFIDNKSRLYRLTEEFEKLDYSEYLSNLGSSVVMSFDPEKNIVYMCDGIYGFIFSNEDNSFASGPVNITGIGVQDETLFVASPATISTPIFEICTDIYDLESRKTKTIQCVEYGIDANEDGQIVYGAIEYRKNIQDDFSSTSWKQLNESGILWQMAFGREFRFKLKLEIYENIELDYIKVKGVEHSN